MTPENATASAPLKSEVELSASTHRFAHRGMGTFFEVVCAHEDREYAAQAAEAGFDLLDRLEGELTRFGGSSDIFRINHLKAGERTTVNTSTMECLLLAKQFYGETGGAFDVSLASGLHSLDTNQTAAGPLICDTASSPKRVYRRLDFPRSPLERDPAASQLHRRSVDRSVFHCGVGSK